MLHWKRIKTTNSSTFVDRMIYPQTNKTTSGARTTHTKKNRRTGPNTKAACHSKGKKKKNTVKTNKKPMTKQPTAPDLAKKKWYPIGPLLLSYCCTPSQLP